MDTRVFATLLTEAIRAVFPDVRVDMTIVRHTRLKTRVDLEKGCHVDIFFREETQRIDYTLICGDMRLFGLDNLKGWHYHPSAEPSQHVPCAAPTPMQALEQIRDVYVQYASLILQTLPSF
ncbi:MAG TPA: hypothetical protein PKV20_24440 [Anaerolineae bacterium]|mgnify:CR=1 FL=1|nr:hypothetical protein [Anaerolineae bacterium]